MNTSKLKHHSKNVAVDVASICIVFAILYFVALGATTLYANYYNTGKAPSPDVFQLAFTQFTGAIGLFYTLQQTRKHYSPIKPEETKTES